MSAPLTLSQLIPGYPEDAPQSLLKIFYAEYSTLPPAAQALRAQAVELAHSIDEVPITSPEVVLELLLPPRSKKEQIGRLKTLSGAWVIYALDEERKRSFSYHARGKSYRRLVDRMVPDDVKKLPALPPRGKYLLVWGGDPSILKRIEGEGELRGRVSQRLARLASQVPVADVLFWDRQPGGTPTLHSLRRGCGDRGGARVEFPDATLLLEAST